MEQIKIYGKLCMEVLLYIEDPCMVSICNARMARLRHDVVGGIYIKIAWKRDKVKF